MNIFKSLGLVALSVFAVSTFSSCEEHNPFSEQELFAQEYSKNFFAKYGNFPANQSWDFSNAPRTAATDPSVFDLGSEIEGGTRADEPGSPTSYTLEQTKNAGILSVPATSTDADYYYVDHDLYGWLHQNLKEEVNNTLLGNPFTLSYSGDSPETQKFAIIPVYKGFGSTKYKLHLVSLTNNADYVIWENWPTTENPNSSGPGTQDFQYQKKDETTWHNVTMDCDMGLQKATGTYRKNYEYFADATIRSKPMIISGLTGEFYLYLELTQVVNANYGAIGDHLSSKAGMMLTLDCDVPGNINEYKALFFGNASSDKTIDKVMVIGVEDHDRYNSDWDMNDIVFLVVGLTDLPSKREVVHSKRYLIEDMGTYVDFDFNDVVVDVTETVIMTNSGSGYTWQDIYTQEAVIKHLCGTLPFKVSFTGWQTAAFTGPLDGGMIQGIVQNKAEEYVDADGNYIAKIQYRKNKYGVTSALGQPFWNASANNIQIVVGSNDELTGQSTWNGSGTYGGIKTAHFQNPDDVTGTKHVTNAPYIIAVPTTVDWTAEGVDFPIGSFTLLDDGSSNNNNNK